MNHTHYVPLHYFIALAGWFIYNFLLFNLAKDKIDKKNKAFPYHAYLIKNWDNWLLTLILAPVLVYYMQDIVNLIGHWFSVKLPTYEIYYLGVGVLTELVYKGFAALKKKELPTDDHGTTH